MSSLRIPALFALYLAFGACAVVGSDPAARPPGEPFAIPPFHCVGLYWSPPGGSADKLVAVRYRAKGASAWAEALPMRYNPIDGTDEDLTDYRGSVVNLSPATAYEFELTLAGTSTRIRIESATWSETFPAGRTVRPASSDQPLTIKESGTASAYRVYDGKGATIDVRHQHDNCILIDASYVIVRGFKLRGAGKPQPGVRGRANAINITGGENIVIEDCDIADWGTLNPQTGFGTDMESAISARGSTLRRVVVQRCKLHDPTFDGSNWSEPTYPTHSAGPQAISLYNTAGNHVIRYNECTSDLDHMYNDIIGGGSNGSFKGAPGPDSDVYGNIVSHCWDDGLEIEGGNRNTRIWGNYIEQTMMGIGNAATSIGPLYLWRNIVTRSQAKPEAGGGNFIKMGFANGEQWMTGHMYIFHNTVFRGDGWLPTGGLGGTRIVKHTISRNNILHVRDATNHSLSNNRANIDDSYDYDLFNGRCPDGQEPHGVRGEPTYGAGGGLDRRTLTGRFELAGTSAGVASGEWIPNFSPGPREQRPDIGAHQRGTPPMQFGVGTK